jgi:hypothetical protein
MKSTDFSGDEKGSCQSKFFIQPSSNEKDVVCRPQHADRGTTVACLVCSYFLFEHTHVAHVHRITSVQDCKDLAACLSLSKATRKKVLVWIDLSEPSDASKSSIIEVLQSVLTQKNIVLLLSYTPANEEHADDFVDQLDFQARFRLDPLPSRPTKTSSLHQEILLHFSMKAHPAEIIDPTKRVPLEQLAKRIEECLPHPHSSRYVSNVADIFVDDDFSTLVRVCVHDICYLHSLRDLILREGEDSFENILYQKLVEACVAQVDNMIVRADRTQIAEKFEEGMLQLSQLTPHQEEKLQECIEQGSCNLHIKAPAGAGKTFIAMHLMQDILIKDKSYNVKVLFVASNEAMAVFVAKWVYERIEGVRQRARGFERLDLLFPNAAGEFADAEVYGVKEKNQVKLESFTRKPSQV